MHGAAILSAIPNAMSLSRYRDKRHFKRTPEPRGKKDLPSGGYEYVIQKHAASRLHYDFRLEMNGVLKSWAVPKGPSLNPANKRLAVHVEDHPIEYGSFEGVIPAGEYGGGTVMLWDRGVWKPQGNAEEAYKQGRLKFALEGKRLQGGWMLARMKRRDSETADNWLLIKEKDAHVHVSPDAIERFEHSIASGRTMEQIAAHRENVWSSGSQSTEIESPKTKSRDTRELRISPSSLTKARKAAVPSTFKPQLATLVADAPLGADWIHEIKFDGYRMLCFIQKGRVRLVTRTGLNWTNKFPSLVEAVSRLSINEGLLDGEIVVPRDDGTTDFQALQNILSGEGQGTLLYYLFDIPFYEQYDLTQTPLLERKALLKQVLERHQSGNFPLRYTEHIHGQGELVLVNACRMAVEGMVSKQVDSPYTQKRTRQWLKVKCLKRQEFVIGGFTDPGGSRTGFGALLLGYYDDDKLRYAGRVGTGFTEEILEELLNQLGLLEIQRMPFADFPRDLSRRGVHWTKPELVAEVEFTEWTSDGVLRHPSFQGLREDKPADEIVRERSMNAVQHRQSRPSPASDSKATSRRRKLQPASSPSSGTRLTNPDRMLYPEQGITKQGLAKYYEAVQSWILPYIIRRPLTVVRCPEGYQKSCFYQKHVTEGLPESIRGIHVKEKHGTMTTLVIDDREGLMGLVQIGVLEIHPWGCGEAYLDKPDRLVFDLDPAPDVSLKALIDAAHLIQSVLHKFGLTSFVKTTGGKGFHVVAPLVPRAPWDKVKQFARDIAGALTRHAPDLYIDVMTKTKRKGKIYIDYLRNAYGATSVAPYSTRAKAGAPVSTPLLWKELGPQLDFTALNLSTIPRRLARLKQDPWAGFFEVRQSITPTMQRQVAKFFAP